MKINNYELGIKMKNYYEILEVDKNASQEVIEKAYKTLAKKYHPDLQTGSKQAEYAEKMKTINEAYEVLSDEIKREEYNTNLQENTIDKEEYNRILQENYQLKNQLNKISEQQSYIENMNIKNSRESNYYQQDKEEFIKQYYEQIDAARRKAYNDAYIQDLKNRGYKIKYKHSAKYYIELIISIGITGLILFLVYQIPFVKDFFQDMYKENIGFKTIIDIFKGIFSNNS